MTESATAPSLDAETIEGFVRKYLLHRFDNSSPIPPFHRVMWQDLCSDAPYCAWAAPRSHAKSTSITLCALLAEALFGVAPFFLLVSDTETQAVSFVAEIKRELRDNEALIRDFGVLQDFEKDNEATLVFSCACGDVCIIARGAEQKVRGLKWRSYRPKRIYVDDLENDEVVLNASRRDKLKRWFQNAVLPSLADDGKVRVVGTILHTDSLLEGLMNSENWKTRRFEAHDDDYGNILWPERFPRSRLESIQQSYIDTGNPEGYMQEYRNRPLDDTRSIFRKDDFPMSTLEESERVVIATDLAVSTTAARDWSVFIVALVDEYGRLHVRDCVRERMDSARIVETFFDLNKRWKPELLGVEKGTIEKSILPFLHAEEMRRSQYVPLWTKASTVNKSMRCRSIAAAMRAGRILFNQTAPWFPLMVWEMVRFPRDTHDDIVDAMSLLGYMIDAIGTQSDTISDEEPHVWMMRQGQHGRNRTCGY